MWTIKTIYCDYGLILFQITIDWWKMLLTWQHKLDKLIYYLSVCLENDTIVKQITYASNRFCFKGYKNNECKYALVSLKHVAMFH